MAAGGFTEVGRKSAGSVDASNVSNEATMGGKAKMCVFYIELLVWAADN